MLYSLTFITDKILTLNISTFLFILVGVLCKFTMVLGVYILLSPQEEEVHLSSLRAKMYTLSSMFIKKIETFVYHYKAMSRLLLNWKKHK